jgi:hypothetical protein
LRSWPRSATVAQDASRVRDVWRALRAGLSPRRFPVDPAKRAFFRYAFHLLDFNQIPGDYCEFGCDGAVTFRVAHEALLRTGDPMSRHLWGFDSFAGLPAQASAADSHPRWEAGNYATALGQFRRLCDSARIPREKYTCVPGFYADTLPQAEAPQSVAFAHIDCDMYTSATEVLAWLAPRMQNGMLVAFDDYFCASAGQLSGERRALIEFEREHPRWRFVPYSQYWWAAQSFLIEDRELDP